LRFHKTFTQFAQIYWSENFAGFGEASDQVFEILTAGGPSHPTHGFALSSAGRPNHEYMFAGYCRQCDGFHQTAALNEPFRCVIDRATQRPGRRLQMVVFLAHTFLIYWDDLHYIYLNARH
jgi:hypothetical protein